MIYICLYGIFFISCIPFEIVDKKKREEDYLNKETTDWIRGIAILIIMIHHAVLQNNKFAFLYPFQVLGYGAVAAFLLLSGYGIGISYKTKENYIDNFFKTKILRLYITFWVAYVVLILGAIIGGNPISIKIIVSNLITMTVIDTATWYIKVQAGLYVTFYLIFRKNSWKNETKEIVLWGICVIYMVLCVIMKMKPYWYFTVLWFPSGLSIALHKKKIVDKIRSYWTPMLCINSVLLVGVIGFRFIYGNLGFPKIMDWVITVNFIVILITICYVIKFKSIIINKIGQLSLELYLIHSMLLTGYLGKWSFNSWIEYILYMIISVVIAYLVMKIDRGLQRGFKERRGL